MRKRIVFPIAHIVLGALCLLAGTYNGLAIAPAEQHMDDVQRIMYIHFAGMLLLLGGAMTIRTRTAALRLEEEIAPPPLRVVATAEVMA